MDKESEEFSINEIAHYRAEANIYSLNNEYLNEENKLEVEMWFQLPGNVLLFVFWSMSIIYIYEPFHWLYFLLIPMSVDLFIGIICWLIYPKKLILILYLSVFHSIVLTIIAVAVFIFLLINGYYLLSILVLVARIGFIATLEPHLLLYTILSKKYKMHAKYAFFKKHYNFMFPFEKYL